MKTLVFAMVMVFAAAGCGKKKKQESLEKSVVNQASATTPKMITSKATKVVASGRRHKQLEQFEALKAKLDPEIAAQLPTPPPQEELLASLEESRRDAGLIKEFRPKPPAAMIDSEGLKTDLADFVGDDAPLTIKTRKGHQYKARLLRELVPVGDVVVTSNLGIIKLVEGWRSGPVQLAVVLRSEDERRVRLEWVDEHGNRLPKSQRASMLNFRGLVNIEVRNSGGKNE